MRFALKTKGLAQPIAVNSPVTHTHTAKWQLGCIRYRLCLSLRTYTTMLHGRPEAPSDLEQSQHPQGPPPSADVHVTVPATNPVTRNLDRNVDADLRSFKRKQPGRADNVGSADIHPRKGSCNGTGSLFHCRSSCPGFLAWAVLWITRAASNMILLARTFWPCRLIMLMSLSI